LARAVTELADGAAAKSATAAVLVLAVTDGPRLIVTISDTADSARGDLALGPKPSAVLALVKRLDAALTASPNPSGRGTDTVLSLPINGVMH
jgi:hypothetical protein